MQVEGNKVVWVEELKYLGTKVSANLTWHSHVNSVVKKCRSRLFLLRKLRQFKVNRSIFSVFYKSCTESIFNLHGTPSVTKLTYSSSIELSNRQS